MNKHQEAGKLTWKGLSKEEKIKRTSYAGKKSAESRKKKFELLEKIRQIIHKENTDKLKVEMIKNMFRE